MDEPIAAEGDADMRGARGHGRKEHEIAGHEVLRLHRHADLELFLDFARQRDAVSPERHIA